MRENADKNNWLDPFVNIAQRKFYHLFLIPADMPNYQIIAINLDVNKKK